MHYKYHFCFTEQRLVYQKLNKPSSKPGQDLTEPPHEDSLPFEALGFKPDPYELAEKKAREAAAAKERAARDRLTKLPPVDRPEVKQERQKQLKQAILEQFAKLGSDGRLWRDFLNTIQDFLGIYPTGFKFPRIKPTERISEIPLEKRARIADAIIASLPDKKGGMQFTDEEAT